MYVGYVCGQVTWVEELQQITMNIRMNEKRKNGITARLGKQQLKLSIDRTSVFLRICQRKTRITRGCKKKGVPIQIRFFFYDRQLSVQEWKGGPPTLFFAFLESGPGFVSTTVFIVCELYTFFFFASGRRRRRTVWIYAAYHLVSRRFAVFDPFYISPLIFIRLQTSPDYTDGAVLCLFTLHLTDVRPWTVVSLFDGRKQALARSKQQSPTFFRGTH